ncbi:leucine-rich repeat domain-containing protein [Methanomethylophilus alvi]|uniref:leucine-rich repeat domain-containing protein n=1 Tax=Methanomethylophilus alvi TaxID=1291540 RepID=UPI0037DDC5AA
MNWKYMFLALSAVISVSACASYVDNGVSNAAVSDDSGSCGPNVTYSFDSKTGVLTICGTGDMDDYDVDQKNQPWWTYRSDVKTVTVGNSVTSVGDYAFSGCTALRSATVADSVTSIGDYAFYGCPLDVVTLGNSVTSIGDYAFSGCPLDVVTIPDSVTSVGKHAFSGCALTAVTIPDSVTSIGEDGFNCPFLGSISVGEGNATFSSIGGVLFSKDAGNLIQYPAGASESYSVPDSVTSIGGRAFYEGTVVSVTIPDSVTSIGDRAFYGCYSLASITLPGSLTSIGADAFYGCSSLTSMTIPDSVSSVGEYAFSRCTGIKNLYVSSNPLLSLGGSVFEGFTFYDKDGSTVIPATAEDLGGRCFVGTADRMVRLAEYTLSGTLTVVGGSASSSDVEVRFSGMAVRTSADGSFSFTVFHGTSGEITASIPGYKQTVTASIDDLAGNVFGKDITMKIHTYAVSGKLTVIGGSASASGVTVSLGQYSAVTGPDGSYVLTAPYGTSGDITASIPGYSQIGKASVNDISSDVSDKDITLKVDLYIISGKLTVVGGSSASAAGATVFFAGMTTTTGSDGSFSFTVPYGTSGYITSSLSGYTQPVPICMMAVSGNISNISVVLKADVYVVVFKDYDGSKISEVSVLWEMSRQCQTIHPEHQTAYAYTFAGWSPSVGAYDGTVTSYTATYDATTIGKRAAIRDITSSSTHSVPHVPRYSWRQV